MVWSHSRLNTYETCPLKFRFGYIDKEEKEVQRSIETFLGSMVHETLEWLYKNVTMTKLPDLKEVLDHYSKLWKKNWNDNIVIVHKQWTSKTYFSLGKKYLTTYYNRYHPFDENTIAIERRISVDLKGGKYKLQGFIDRLVYNEKTKEYEIHDYKTNKYLPDQAKADADRQLALYAIGIKSMFSDASKVKLIWHYLHFDKEVVSKRSGKELSKLKKDIIKLIDKIEKAKKLNKFPAKESHLCNWCEFRPICPRFKHLYKVKDKPVNQYMKEPGVKLVNTYAVLKAREKKFKDTVGKEMAKVKEALIEYAKKKGLEVIVGSNQQVTVKIKEDFKWPKKGSEEREKLNKVIRSLRKWNEVSALDTNALSSIVIGREWDSSDIRKIKKFGSVEESSRVNIGKRKDLEY